MALLVPRMPSYFFRFDTFFKISKLKTNSVNPNIGMYFSGGTGLQKTVINAQLGISIEALSTLDGLASSAAAAATETSPASRFSYINI